MDFELDGKPYVGLNGGPMFPFTEAVSLQVMCADQAEVDHYWSALLADGGVESQCGWLKDRFGFSWQVVPTELPALLGRPGPRARPPRGRVALHDAEDRHRHDQGRRLRS